MHGSACKQYIFRSVTHLLSTLCVFMKILSHASGKSKTRRLKGLKFRNFTGLFFFFFFFCVMALKGLMLTFVPSRCRCALSRLRTKPRFRRSPVSVCQPCPFRGEPDQLGTTSGARHDLLLRSLATGGRLWTSRQSLRFGQRCWTKDCGYLLDGGRRGGGQAVTVVRQTPSTGLRHSSFSHCRI